VALGIREMVSLSESGPCRLGITADAAALTFNKQNHMVVKFSP